jgi:purine-nucleoside phosphorylase
MWTRRPSTSSSGSSVSLPEAPVPPAFAVDDALAAVRTRSAFVPRVVIVLGSGLADALVGFDEEARLSFADLTGFPEPTVPGHVGSLLLGTLSGVPVAVFLGRIHFYEQHEMAACSMTVRLGAALGARVAVLTAAVGGVAPEATPGSVVIVDDHINMMGVNALAGWRFPDGSPAFVDLSAVYDPILGNVAERSAGEADVTVTHGVYAALPGPSYETAAETEFLRRGGATVVGMSMVPEAVAAHAVGMRVLGLAVVVNAAGTAIDHTTVVAEGHRTADATAGLLAAILPRLD